MTYTIEEISTQLYAAVISDALDSLGYRNQSPNVHLPITTVSGNIVGRCKTTLWADIFHEDPAPYELELQAVDTCMPGDVLIAAAGGSQRSGIWGELLSTAALNRGCVGAIVDGQVRDLAKMRDLGFPVRAKGTNIYDSKNRQMVIKIDVQVKIGTVVFSPGDLVFCDEDGIVVVPQEIEQEAIQMAMEKVNAENVSRDEIKKGAKAGDVYKKYGVL
ncbi:MAG: RraA family protein [Lunatimonas sp.]|uniref:RraA family protein n=1 Tax=Lunatimonas sp. TaxID=2060141 RepID=UPI00263B5168|nr:RraA family protein [Lunatimonas sp.]MCC5939211.1 RraA family protein [Lunatimonas sp.]